jgi:hypothetical protein
MKEDTMDFGKMDEKKININHCKNLYEINDCSKLTAQSLEQFISDNLGCTLVTDISLKC